MSKAFASHADTEVKTITFSPISEHAWTAERNREMWETLES